MILRGQYSCQEGLGHIFSSDSPSSKGNLNLSGNGKRGHNTVAAPKGEEGGQSYLGNAKGTFYQGASLIVLFLIFVYLEQIGPLLVGDVLDVVQVDVGQLGVVVGRLLDHLVDVCTVRRLLGEHLAVVCNVDGV